MKINHTSFILFSMQKYTLVVTIFTQEKSTSCARKTESVFRRMSIHLNKNVQIMYYNIHHTCILAIDFILSIIVFVELTQLALHHCIKSWTDYNCSLLIRYREKHL